MDLTEQGAEQLVERARAAAANAYAPASKFHVGAAILLDDGRVFSGCNVENSSFGLTICAERNAVFQAVAAGGRKIVAVAVYTPLQIPGSPCGACRQVLAEFAEDDCIIMLVGDDPSRGVEKMTLGELLPRPFRFECD